MPETREPDAMNFSNAELAVVHNGTGEQQVAEGETSLVVAKAAQQKALAEIAKKINEVTESFDAQLQRLLGEGLQIFGHAHVVTATLQGETSVLQYKAFQTWLQEGSAEFDVMFENAARDLGVPDETWNAMKQEVRMDGMPSIDAIKRLEKVVGGLKDGLRERTQESKGRHAVAEQLPVTAYFKHPAMQQSLQVLFLSSQESVDGQPSAFDRHLETIAEEFAAYMKDQISVPAGMVLPNGDQDFMIDQAKEAKARQLAATLIQLLRFQKQRMAPLGGQAMNGLMGKPWHETLDTDQAMQALKQTIDSGEIVRLDLWADDGMTSARFNPQVDAWEDIVALQQKGAVHARTHSMQDMLALLADMDPTMEIRGTVASFTHDHGERYEHFPITIAGRVGPEVQFHADGTLLDRTTAVADDEREKAVLEQVLRGLVSYDFSIHTGQLPPAAKPLSSGGAALPKHEAVEAKTTF